MSRLTLSRSASPSSVIDRLRRLGPSIEKICHSEAVPGVSVGVLHHGKTLYTENFGFRDRDKATPTDSNTLYGVGSITKSMVLAGIGKLVDDGKFQWSTRVKESSSGVAHEDPRFIEEVTVADFLAHRSGLAGIVALSLAFQGDGQMILPRDSLFEVVQHMPRMAPVRQSWMYCVWGYSIAAHIIEQVSQRSLHEYLQDELFQPLGMRRTTLGPSFNEEENVAEPYAALSNGEACRLKNRQHSRARVASFPQWMTFFNGLKQHWLRARILRS